MQSLVLGLFVFALSPALHQLEVVSSNQEKIQACTQSCLAWNDRPGPELRACIAKCQKLAN